MVGYEFFCYWVFLEDYWCGEVFKVEYFNEYCIVYNFWKGEWEGNCFEEVEFFVFEVFSLFFERRVNVDEVCVGVEVNYWVVSYGLGDDDID